MQEALRMQQWNRGDNWVYASGVVKNTALDTNIED